MENILWIIIGVLVGGILFYFLFGKKKENENNNSSLLLLQQSISELTRTMDQKLGESHKQVNESLRYHSSESNTIIS